MDGREENRVCEESGGASHAEIWFLQQSRVGPGRGIYPNNRILGQASQLEYGLSMLGVINFLLKF